MQAAGERICDHTRALEPTQASVCHGAKAGVHPQNDYGQSSSAPPVASLVHRHVGPRVNWSYPIPAFKIESRNRSVLLPCGRRCLFSIRRLESRSGGLNECTKSRAEAQIPKDVHGDLQYRVDVPCRCLGHDNRVSRFGVRPTSGQTIRRGGSRPRDRFVRGRAIARPLHVRNNPPRCRPCRLARNAVDASMGVVGRSVEH